MKILYLNGDGMVNLDTSNHALKQVDISKRQDYWATKLTNKAFDKFLEVNQLQLSQHKNAVNGFNIIDLDDQYIYGFVKG